MRQDSNPQPFDHEFSLLSTRPDFCPDLLIVSFRRDTNRYVQTVVQGRPDDHWEGGCRKQLRQGSLHYRERTSNQIFQL